MIDRANSDGTPLGVTELLAWVAGLSAVAGLVAEVVRRADRESAAGLVGGLLVVYVVYLSVSVRAFWTVPRMAIPITMLIGGTLWTISLQFIDRSDLTRAVISTIFIPLATAYSVRLIFPEPVEPDGIGSAPKGPSLVHSLLDRGKGFGNRVDGEG
jgi:hypothetical protein